MTSPRQPLSPLEHQVMAIVWKRGTVTAEEVTAGLGRRLSNATIRTILRRLEAKGYLRHTVSGRAFVYAPTVGEGQAAHGAMRRLMQRFFGGSAAQLLVGMVDQGLIAPEEIRALARRLRSKPRRKGPRD